jgi:multiple sugar transport system ATP-binding protein
MAEIRLEKILKLFGKTAAVNQVSLTIHDGEFMVLLGPSGCGKTTLLRCLAGLELPDGGNVFIGNQDVTEFSPRKRNIAMVFQNYAVFPHMSVYDNIGFGLKMKKMGKSEIQENVTRAAKLLEVDKYLDRYPAQLSGGQRQRVAVARAIAMNPAVLLMDEPLSNLDALLRMQMRAELKRLLQEIGATTVYVTHDQIEALSMGDRIAVMKSGEIAQVDVPMKVYTDPANTFVGGFIGSPPMNFLSGKVERQDGQVVVDIEGQRLPAPANLAKMAGQNVTVGLRAENILPGNDGAGSPGLPTKVLVVEPLGSHLLLTTQLGKQSLKVVTPADYPIMPDQALWLKPDLNKLRWLDAESGALLQIN